MTRLLLCAFAGCVWLAAQPNAPLPARTQNVTAPSHVYSRGGLEILTFETEEACAVALSDTAARIRPHDRRLA